MEGFCFFDPIRYNKRYDVKSAGGQLRTMARKLDLPVSEIVSGAVASVLSRKMIVPAALILIHKSFLSRSA